MYNYCQILQRRCRIISRLFVLYHFLLSMAFPSLKTTTAKKLMKPHARGHAMETVSSVRAMLFVIVVIPVAEVFLCSYSLTAPLPSLQPMNGPSTPIGRRSLGPGNKLLDSLKKSFHLIRRSISIDRRGRPATAAASRSYCRSRSRSRCRADKSVKERSVVLLRRFPDESCLIQLRRDPTTNQFDVDLQVDASGNVFVSHLTDDRQYYSCKGQKFMRLGDRVMEVQNTLVKDLPKTADGRVDPDHLLQDCQTALLRVIALKYC